MHLRTFPMQGLSGLIWSGYLGDVVYFADPSVLVASLRLCYCTVGRLVWVQKPQEATVTLVAVYGPHFYAG